MTGRFANIIVDISHEKVDRPFQYRIPDALMGKLEVGMAVMIPFAAVRPADADLDILDDILRLLKARIVRRDDRKVRPTVTIYIGAR